MAEPCLHLVCVIENAKAVRALAHAARYLIEHAEGREWDAEAVKAARAARYALRRLTTRKAR